MVLTIILNKNHAICDWRLRGRITEKETADEVDFVGGFMEFTVPEASIDSLSWIRLIRIVRHGPVVRGTGVRFHTGI